MDLSQSHDFDKIVSAIAERMPAHVNALKRTLEGLTQDERSEAEAYCRYLLTKHSPAFLVEAYKTVVDDTFAAQVDFFRTKKYKWSSFREVANDVYFNSAYMDRYMVGLALTTFLWTNHVEIFRFFRDTLPTNKEGRYLEIGPGHGFFFLQAAKHGSFQNLLGVDLSPASIALTDDVIRNLAPESYRVSRFLQTDFLSAEDLQPPFDAIVMGEVLEHVEEPALFLKRIASLASPTTHVFITTCVNAPAIDHIYLFRKTREVEDMIERCGLIIAAKKDIPYPGKSLEVSEQKDLPINVAYVLTAAAHDA